LREPGKTLVFVSSDAHQECLDQLVTAGAEVFSITKDADGGLDLRAVLAELGRRDVVSLLVEGGGMVLGSLFDAGLVDKVHAFIAPVIIGGNQAASPVEGQGAVRMVDAWRMERCRLQQIGSDWLITGYPSKRG
jgi:diaminohydroxyphosphoribosylaminopyrimidine deaminase / 5-amino-6-(5-phosphoribosylamino)uracil reductase